MAKFKINNVAELVDDYDEEFINSISLNGIKSIRELKELLNKLEKANYIITTFYQTMYNDYMMAINSDALMSDAPDIDTLKRYKSLASKIQKIYSYILYVFTFENPFKVSK